VDPKSRIFVAGAGTVIGAAIVGRLQGEGIEPLGPEPDHNRPGEIDSFFAKNRPEYVFVAGARSGGILANQRYPADLMLDNQLQATAVLDAAHRHGARKLLYLASSCIYPRIAPQPLTPGSLWAGPLEPTNEAYATAKLAGLVLCHALRQQHGAPFITGIPTNYFGPGDHFDVEDSHVIAALIRRMHDAQTGGLHAIDVWGTGRARREFAFVDDLADACVFVMRNYEDEAPINIGGGTDVSIAELAALVKEVVGFEGKVCFDTSKPDGMPLKALDSSVLLSMGWRPATSLKCGLERTYRWFQDNRV
jgi:GDP-L-fucose synthase